MDGAAAGDRSAMPGDDVDDHGKDPDEQERLARDLGEELTDVFAGYVRGGERGLQRRAGWLHTGDLGMMDGAGFVTFHRVLKPMFTRSGFNVYPAELARVVGELPGVRAVRVRAIPSPLRENDIALDVVGDVDRERVARWCAERLSSYKQPTEITITSG